MAALKDQNGEAIARGNKAAARRNRQDAAPEYAATITKASRADSLVSVGNFLGSSSGGIVQIAKQQLQITKEQKVILEDMLKELKKQVPQIGVPAGS